MPKKKPGYQEGPGFDRKPFDTGFQQGTLFRREAPARINRRTEQEHLGPDPEDLNRHRNSFNRNPAQYEQRYGRFSPENVAQWDGEVDLRQLKGRVTGNTNFDLGHDLFHGTAARLKPGSLISPGRNPNFGTNGQNWGNGQSLDTKRENVFATPSMANAFNYAQNAREMRETRGNVTKGNGRAYVYRVQPTGPVSFDKEDVDARHGYNDPGDETTQFQSRHPLRVLHPVQFHEAQEAYRSYMEDDLGNEPGQYKYAPRVRQEELW